jgi:hypothetical protein
LGGPHIAVFDEWGYQTLRTSRINANFGGKRPQAYKAPRGNPCVTLAYRLLALNVKIERTLFAAARMTARDVPTFGAWLQLRFLIFASFVSLALSSGLAAQTHHKAKKEAETPAPVAPPVPLTPAQMPAAPPTVAFSAGQLTITAPNSTLGDILREVRKQTGASVDVPGNATERVMGTFGPGPARDVLASLLNGSHFNYVLLGSVSNPAALDRVMLISKPAADPANQPTNTAQVQNPGAPAAGGQAGEAMEFGNEESADQQPESGDIFGNATADEQPNQTQADDQQQNGQANPFGNGNGVKTPDQLLQELQQRQQQGAANPGGLPTPGGPRFGTPAGVSGASPPTPQ